ncbi:gephyrin-like molybdotransferase Glp [Sphingomonas sp. NIBR02145]|uniref:molybdopterin molybdotransferase MoeA n=1 Tax=Sphingomonas sp. NIBR02145 TaxID=3014784 RepID=UPI0022B3D8B1|nr:gephyrin-like molybdotransferase Glp [Sphingomonas sp. NIBR02145]WHU02911.1 molybdopterin molybdotransferase MoeA [Sphingomonas sp. NIBR02145]
MAERRPRPSVDAALDMIERMVSPLGSETVAAADALGRITAEPAIAALDVPRFAASAMDGFAVRSVDVLAATQEFPVDLPLGAPVPAGSAAGALAAGHAVPISTGAPLPEGADAVLVRELGEIVRSEEGARLRVRGAIDKWRNVRTRGEDMARGGQLIGAGHLITADAIGALAACGIERLAVRRMPRIVLVSSGSELAASSAALSGEAKVIDSNAPMILATARSLGLPVRFQGRMADTHAAVTAMLDTVFASGDADIVISTGGVSVGDFDLVRAGLEARGATLCFHGVQMRPGKPLLFAKLPDGRPYFGLPGNPVAAFVAFRFFVMAAVRRMLGLPREAAELVSANAEPREGTTLFLRGRRMLDAEGRVRIDTGLDQRSHVLSSVVHADHWLRVSPDAPRFLAYPKLPLL